MGQPRLLQRSSSNWPTRKQTHRHARFGPDPCVKALTSIRDTVGFCWSRKLRGLCSDPSVDLRSIVPVQVKRRQRHVFNRKLGNWTHQKCEIKLPLEQMALRRFKEMSTVRSTLTRGYCSLKAFKKSRQPCLCDRLGRADTKKPFGFGWVGDALLYLLFDEQHLLRIGE